MSRNPLVFNAEHPLNPELDANPVLRAGAFHICDIAAGAKIIALNGALILVAPDGPPSFITPTGLVELPRDG